jgi:hypothetical protein
MYLENKVVISVETNIMTQHAITAFIYLFICSSFNEAFSVTQNFASSERVVSEWWTENGLEGNGRGLILRNNPVLE